MYEFIVLVDEYSCELDQRQQSKVRHPLSVVLLLVFICELAGIEHWNEMSDFLVYNQSILEAYLPLKYGIPSYDMLERVISMVSEGVIEGLRTCFTEQVLLDFSDNYQRILSIDGKTVRGNASAKQTPLHIVTGFEGDTRY
ncbi:TPA: transposase family protein [Streptococcus suis]|nr:transposase family protein [Streptococcus suis]HEM5200597.1 transposase family protein [Streptococcus suis]